MDLKKKFQILHGSRFQEPYTSLPARAKSILSHEGTLQVKSAESLLCCLVWNWIWEFWSCPSLSFNTLDLKNPSHSRIWPATHAARTKSEEGLQERRPRWISNANNQSQSLISSQNSSMNSPDKLQVTFQKEMTPPHSSESLQKTSGSENFN